MRETIRKQLESCIYADLNNFDKTTNTYTIPKYSKPKYDIGKMYLIKLPGYLVNNNNSVTSTNWNNGTSPIMPYLKIYVSKAMGKMIYVDSIAYDFENKKDTCIMWSGWLPTEEITQLAAA